MAKKTAIAWTNHTFNPWWGCTKVSAGCTRCYAEKFAARVGGDWWGAGKARRTFGEKHWREPLAWNTEAEKSGERRRVFCASMADVFDAEAPAGERDRLWSLISETPHLDWLLLTKRPENVAGMLPALWGEGWPNVWLGTTVEDADAMWRIDVLRRVPAALHFISAEPLVGPWVRDLFGIGWVIVGGESGPRARPMDVEWARAIRDACRRSGPAFFMKQLGGNPDKREILGDFPEDLRIREFPEVTR